MGEISVRAYFSMNNLFQIEPILYLRARGLDREAVDLISPDSACKMLTPTGCSYDFNHRPTGGTLLIPKRPHKACEYPAIEQEIFLASWKLHQIPLKKVVTRLTNKSVEKEVLEEVKKWLEICYMQEQLSEDIKTWRNDVQALSLIYPPLKEAVLKKEIKFN